MKWSQLSEYFTHEDDGGNRCSFERESFERDGFSSFTIRPQYLIQVEATFYAWTTITYLQIIQHYYEDGDLAHITFVIQFENNEDPKVIKVEGSIDDTDIPVRLFKRI